MFVLVHATIIKKQVRSVRIFDPIDGVKGRDVFLTGEKATYIGSKGLAISLKFGILRITLDVVEHILCNVRSRAKREPRGVRKGKLRINEPLVVPFILGHVSLEFF